MQTTETLKIELPLETVQAIEERVNSGDYASTSDVIQEAIRVLERNDEDRVARLNSIRQRIEHSLADPRPSLDATSVRTRLESLHAETLEKISR